MTESVDAKYGISCSHDDENPSGNVPGISFVFLIYHGSRKSLHLKVKRFLGNCL